jgi:hypothetical protein
MREELVIPTLAAPLAMGMVVASSCQPSRHGYDNAEDPDYESQDAKDYVYRRVGWELASVQGGWHVRGDDR